MSMSRKTYQAVADSIRDQRQTVADHDESEWSDGMKRGATAALNAMVANLANVFAADNPLFDRQRFYAACSVNQSV